MISKDEQVRATIAEQASKWLVTNDEAPLNTHDSAALVAWLKVSPVHVEEFLGVAAIARDLQFAAADPELSLDELVARARGEKDSGRFQTSSPGWFTGVRDVPERRWQLGLVAVATVVLTSLGVLLWNLRPVTRLSVPAAATVLHYATQHGGQRTYRLADNSVLHLNTDTAVTVRYSQTERVVVLTAGEAVFEVTHEPKRAFTVLAGPARILDLGTRFDVRLRADTAVVTVVAGRVAVEPSRMAAKGEDYSSRNPPVQLSANQQVTVAEGQAPGATTSVDAERTTAWLHRQIAFEHEPLERVAAEFNRYAAKPIEITAPALRQLEVTGVFSTDDPEELLAFLRSLEGVRVEVTATRIRVSQK